MSPYCPKCGTSMTRVSGTGDYYCPNTSCSEYNKRRHVPVELRQDTAAGRRSTKPASKFSLRASTTTSVKDDR
jgi:uncharacterized Zn finger protein (UPF0148 family)